MTAQLIQAARLCPCGQCWAQPGLPCQTDPPCDHLARYLRAARRGLIDRDDLRGLLVADEEACAAP